MKIHVYYEGLYFFTAPDSSLLTKSRFICLYLGLHKYY